MGVIRHIRILLITLLTAGTLFLMVAPANALPFTGLLPVGGFVSSQIFCANGTLLFVGPPRGGAYMFSAGSRLFARFSPFAGHHLLGLVSPGGACVCPNGNCEVGAIGAQGTFVIVGTS